MKYFIDFALFCHDFLVFLAKKLAGMETFRIFAAQNMRQTKPLLIKRK